MMSDNNGNNALHTAVLKSSQGPTYIEIIKLILKSQYLNINAMNFWGDTALTTAIMNNCEGEVIDLILEAKSDVNSNNNLGQKPLDLAFVKENYVLMEKLIENGALVSSDGLLNVLANNNLEAIALIMYYGAFER